VIVFLVESEFSSSSYKRIIIKIGSDVITDQKIEEVARDCSKLAKEKEIIIVSSGAIKTGKGIISLKGEEDIHQKQAYAAIGQPYLMSKYNAAFNRYNQPIAQNLFTRQDVNQDDGFRNRYHNTVNTLERLLSNSVIPIINENDTTAVEEIRFGDNDTLSALVSNAMSADLLIFLSNVDGVYRSYHSKHRQLIPIVYRDQIEEVKQHCVDEKTENGSGGMISKINAAEISGCYSLIVNGNNKDAIRNIFTNNYRGTLFVPEQNIY
jgi:glutamate 5-kinase